VIVCGLRGVGLRIVEQLHAAGARVVVIDEEPDRLLDRSIAALGVPRVAGSTRELATFEEAGLGGAAAVACVMRDDLRTLETGLLVNEHSPGTRVILGLDNPAVGRGVEGVLGAGSVLDIAGLFAPSVIETCTRENAHRLSIEGAEFALAEAVVDEKSTLRERFADLAPMGLAAGNEGELQVCPGRDTPIAPGDRAWVFGTVEELTAAGVVGRRPRVGGRPVEHPRPAATQWNPFRVLGRPDRSIVLVLAAVLVLVVLSSLLLRFNYHRPGTTGHLTVLDSIYFTVETISTVGFGDFSFSGQAPWLEAFGVLLIVLGAAILTTLFSLITNALVRRRIDQSLGRAGVTRVSSHTILVGLGAVGMRVLEGLLARGQEVVVVEHDEGNRYLNQARALGVRVIVGDATMPRTLELVNLSGAAAVAILTSDDLTNIETGLAVRDALAGRFGDVPIVLRVFDTALSRRVQRSFRFHHVWSTSAIAAPWFIGAALGLDVLATFYVDHEPFLLARLTVAHEGGLAGVAMRELSAEMRVVAIRRAGGPELEHPPRRDTRFAPGDRAYLAGPSEELLKVLRREQHEM
jgi:Trk K+ transport system NAD-binding subunit